ncbi:hypothetical protein FA95DRAFT_917346 [Auriscalpium vulgare]|uniref:Uncharacterized protein n=1 Tax=Auriscalpium vulgare TaxID=40419 RepID=A0ACB8R8A2_9AGAM|nr:hypothetical protein FA95DRAFT_917346 [Auriscalpium vulgare]
MQEEYDILYIICVRIELVESSGPGWPGVDSHPDERGRLLRRRPTLRSHRYAARVYYAHRGGTPHSRKPPRRCILCISTATIFAHNAPSLR